MKPNRATKEKQYQFLVDTRPEQLGLMSGQVYRDDPRRLTFLLARYKFVAKMFSGFKNVLEVGCADAFGTRLVRQEVERVVATDFDPIFIDDALSRSNTNWNVEYKVHDMLASPPGDKFDGAYCCDVLEHIEPRDEDRFIANIVASLGSNGVAIFGLPSLESQIHASLPSKEGHVNCKTAADLRSLLLRFFHNVFVFSMNDEVVHTGFHPMAHYLFGLCCSPRR
jgi:2-polyprenyl-3-methyl-5-hydroxy-6-metoxy-1,4-benzoquinol methylase